MTSGEEACPACGESEWVCYTSEYGRFRIHCAMCGHSTRLHPDLDLARLEWLGSRDEVGRQ